MNYTPETDGIDHINVYSKAKTDLGKFLSNFTYAKIKTQDGIFSSIEGYWYWLLSSDHPKHDCYECNATGTTVLDIGAQSYFGPCDLCNRETLRYLSAAEAKKVGRIIAEKDRNKDTTFQNKIKKAIEYKINNSTNIKNQFIKSTLPFTHYYIMYGNIIVPTTDLWVIEHIESLRTSLVCKPTNP